jgi:hypothetical protein
MSRLTLIFISGFCREGQCTSAEYVLKTKIVKELSLACPSFAVHWGDVAVKERYARRMSKRRTEHLELVFPVRFLFPPNNAINMLIMGTSRNLFRSHLRRTWSQSRIERSRKTTTRQSACLW